VGLVDEGSGPHLFHPRYGERTRPVRGGTIDGDDIENRAAYCMNLEASGGCSGDGDTEEKESEVSGGDNGRDGCDDEKKKREVSDGHDGRDEGGGDAKEHRGRGDDQHAVDKPCEGRLPTGGMDTGPQVVSSARGLPVGVIDGCPPFSKVGTTANGPRKVHHDIPLALPREGRNYTKCAPLSATVTFGKTKRKCLMDPVSNTSIIDFDKLQESYPDTAINDSVQIAIHGVGQAATVGWVVLPATVHARDASGPVNVEMDVEWHVMRNFKPGLLLVLSTSSYLSTRSDS
jgi:hypothetical protein